MERTARCRLRMGQGKGEARLSAGRGDRDLVHATVAAGRRPVGCVWRLWLGGDQWVLVRWLR
ncbi:hypothetical protein ABZP36_023468 [Zizania latifolia]